MTVLNQGYALLDERPLAEDEPAVFCVLGTGGGGTSMTSRLLEAAGVFMGENLGYNAEDPHFALLLKDPEPNPATFRNLVARRSADHRRWGFKAPFRFHWKLLSGIENVRFVTVIRDVFAAGSRARMASGAQPLRAMTTALDLQKEIVTALAASDRPKLIFSYEKAVVAPRPISEAILRFAGAEASEEAVARLGAVVEPNNPVYVAGQAAIPAGRR